MVEPIEQGFHASPQQRRVWQLQRDGLTSCTSLCALRIEGALDRPALRRALATTVERHEILRTAFRLPAGLTAPLQIILEPGPITLPEVDLQALSAERRTVAVADLPAALCAPPFDLARGAVWRAALAEIGPHEHCLLLALSTMCADAATFEPLAADLFAAYARQVTGGREDPDAPLQYADISAWQNSLLEADDTAEAVEAWREHWQDLSLGARLAQPLPLEERDAAPGPFTPREVAVPLTPATVLQLERLADAWGCPLHVLLLTAWKGVIQRGTGHGETLVGVLYAGRDAEELRGVVGPLARYLPIAAHLDPEAPLRRSALQVQEAVAEAERRGEYFSWDCIAGAGTEGAASGGFPICFERVEAGWELSAAGLRIAPIPSTGGCALLDGFSLSLSCCGAGNDLRLALRYDARHFRRASAHRLSGRLAALLNAVAVRPDAPLASHPTMDEDETGLWRALSATPAAAGREHGGKTLHTVFEERVDRAPDRLAVTAGDGRLTFRELDEQANRLARHLRAAGAGPEVPVALCLDRTAAAVAALLAVWKAGAAYVPLDPTQPVERLAYLLADTGTPLLVTDSRLAASLPGGGDLPGVRTVRLDEEAAVIAARPGDRLASSAGPSSLAYLIYTSGSMGRPKGVQVEHRSALRLLAALETAVLDPLTAEPGLASAPLLASLNAPMIFDASVQQLALLLAGHSLCVVPQEVRADGTALLAFLREQEVDLLDCTPSQLRLLVDAGLLDGPAGPRIVLTAGEAVDEVLWRRLARAERMVVYNLYGPTECSVDATFHRIEHGSTEPTIGRPLPGYEAYLLDRFLQPVPPGAPGELCLGGDGLARSYLGRPALTAERFLPHPFAKRPGERLYRTGDLGRHRPDGNLEFLGRLDHQVKIRGYRIELGEIEAVLASHPWVQEAVALALPELRTDTGRQSILVAYVRLTAAAGADSGRAHGELHGFLRQQLPAYMVPAAFVILDAFPLTPSGKVDRRALPLPSLGRPGLTSEYEAPATPVELLLVSIWEEVLNLERVGVRDDFFELGGHSLLATQMISRVRAALHLEISVRRLFETPTVAGLAAAVEAGRAGGAAAAPPIVPVSRDRPLPLSFAQQRLWFLDRLTPGSPAYNITTMLRLRGDLDIPALAGSFAEIARRHEGLRTTFLEDEEGTPRQVVAAPAGPRLDVVDLRALPAAARAAEAARLAGQEALRPFNLTRGPLLRMTLLQRDEREWTALLGVHHIVSDGWSVGVLVRELSVLYPAFLQGLQSPLPPLPIQYADYAVWQRAWLQGPVLEAWLGWWREELAGAPAQLDLPADRPRPPLASARGATVEVLLEPSLSAGLASLARRDGATLFMVLLAGLQALLHGLTGEEDLLIGSPIAGRNRAELEGLIGLFVNTLVLRGRMDGDPAFHQLLARSRANALGAYAHQEIPFERLVDELGVERSLAYNPLFQVMLALQNAPVERLELPGVRLEPDDFATATAKLDLEVALTEWDGAIVGAVEYATDLFDAVTIQRLIGHFKTLLRGAVADPERRLSALPLLSESERHQVRVDWNDTAFVRPQALSAYELFARQAERTPAAPALTWEEGASLTYAELAHRADHLARHLAAQLSGPAQEEIVAVLAERGPHLLTAILALWKAGRVYLPLDPHHPADRQAQVLRESRARAVLATAELAPAATRALDRLTGLEAARQPRLLGFPDVAEPAPPCAFLQTAPEQLAYVIFTSGSTGVAKGAMVEHRGMLNHLQAKVADLGLSAADCVAQTASQCFDISIWQLLAPLLVGGRVAIVDDETVRNPSLLLAEVRRRGVTILETVPSLLRALVEEVATGGEPAAPDTLRWLLSTGEALPLDLCNRWLEVVPHVPLLNAYGPTECSDDVTHGVVRQPLRRAAAMVPIGRPVTNFRLTVVDRGGELQPPGVPGELCAGGIGVGRGYLHDPARTAVVFVPDPFSDEPGARLYRTGDLARWHPSGELEFLGRLDHQVKIRGFRIELGEIEAVLRESGLVRDAVVVPREEAGRFLVAYVVPRDEALATELLREHLRIHLPDSMLPALFVALPALPLTANGKVDRRALPAPERPRGGSRDEEPRTAPERLLAGIWAEVLRLDRVGAHENFFELGGDSILSLQVVSRAVRVGLRITPRQVFEHPTVAALAAVAGTLDEVRAEQGPVVGRVPLTPIQHGFFDGFTPDPHHSNQAVLLAPREPLPPAVTAQALAALLTHHDALRIRFAEDEEGWHTWSEAPGGPLPWGHLDLSGLSMEESRSALVRAAAQVQTSLDLSSGPLLRAVWADLAEGQARLLLVIHHLVVDGVSWRILLEDLEIVCRQLRSGEAISLPPKTTSFQEWAERLVAHARSLEVGPELAWWRREAEAPLSTLAIDYAGGDNTEASTRRVSVALSDEETRTLLQQAPAAYRTQINDILLTALARTLAGPGRALLVELEGHGREEIFDDVDLSRTVGWLTAAFPVRLEAGPPGDPGAALRQVKEHLRAIPRRGLGHGLLLWLRGEEVAADELRRLPRPEVTFNYLGQLDSAISASSLFGPAGEATGPSRSPRERRSELLTVNAAVVGGRLWIDWVFSASLHDRSTVEVWAAELLGRLRELIACCSEAVARQIAGYTPSDFPLANLDQPELDRLLGTEWGIEDVYPLSPLQEGILFHSFFAPGSGVYVEQLLAHLREDVDSEALGSACRLLLDRHPILRTSFHGLDLQRPLQIVHSAPAAALESEDWRGLPADELERRLRGLLQSDRERGFVLSQAPLIRWRLLHTGEGEHYLLWSHHHLLLDGWSCAALAQELLAAYAALRRGEQPDLPRRRPFREYIAWLERQDLGQAEEHWRRILSDWSEPTPLPGTPESGRSVPGTDACETLLPAAVTARLQARARSSRVTLNTITQAVWGLLLGRSSGRSEVLFGATVSGRPPELPGIESMIGLFINTLPVRLQVEEGEIGPWLEQIQAEQAVLRQLEHSPLTAIQSWSRVPRNMPLFESILVFENYPRETALQAGHGDPLGVGEVRAVAQASYPLTVIAVPGDRLRLRIAYDAARFDAATVDRMLLHLQALLEGLADDPAQRLGDLTLLTAAERLQLIGEWNDTRQDWPRPGALHELVERAAERHPQAPAILFEGEEVTYGELERRANRLAHRLLRLGVTPETRVGLACERSPEALVAMLGVLKAGGAYVPLDPESPRDRLAAIASDAGVALLLTQSRLAPELSGLAEQILALDAPEANLDGESAVRPGLSVLEDSAAYVIYTSGSTGLPKGVVATHRGVANFVRGLAAAVGLGPTDRFLLFAPLSFDASVLQIFPPLMSGAAVVVHRNPRELTANDIVALCVRRNLTVLDLPAALWRQWVEEVSAQNLVLPESLRAFLTGGEKVPASTLRAWAGLAARPVSFLSSYGPTEATVTATVFQTTSDRVAQSTDPGDAAVSIGRPLPNVRVYSLDTQLRPLPWGVPGELYLGGKGLARGYLGRPDLTAETFVPDPLGGEPGARLYRTGDLACHRADGNLEFLGRVDLQIKLRGFRIEPGEIEAALRRHPAVREAAVLLRADPPGDPRLTAYVVLRGGFPADPVELRTFLSGLLPAAMVPSAFVPLEEMPVLPSGKLDRTALPAPAAAGVIQAPGLVSPRDPVEQILAEIWAQVLKVERVGAFDDFFELGGHSLMATQALARIRQAFEIDLELRSLFEEPTVAGLAALLRQSSDGDRVERTAALRTALAGLSDEEVEALLLAGTTSEKGFQP